MKIELLSSIHDIAPTDWDALVNPDDPFTEHAFLAGMETSGSVGPQTGWLPRPVILRDAGRIVGAVPAYVKGDSYGEFVFDWAWAEASLRAGIAYYPKLVAAVPYTPVTGQRLLMAKDREPGPLVEGLCRALAVAAQDCGASGVHVLFCDQSTQASLTAQHYTPRQSFQFQWHRLPTWETFDDFATSLRAPARKNMRRERRRAQAHGLHITMRHGCELSATDWEALHVFYRQTIAQKGSYPYLTPQFFVYMRDHLPHRVVAALAYDGSVPVAGALFFRRGKALYGRYWGAVRHYDCLHFELCYYLPIAWALQNGIVRFEAGAQGEHKLQRGLLPTPCYSAHALRHPGLREAVDDFLKREGEAVAQQMIAHGEHTPFDRGDKTP